MHEVRHLKNLNDIKRGQTRGIYKRWIYKKDLYMPMCDFMQKINYSIQDLNALIEKLNGFNREHIVYIIVLVDWIKEAFEKIYKSINPKVVENFIFEKSQQIEKAKKYFLAIRSFVVAHPLSTDRHELFGFDGNFICIDIREKSQFAMIDKSPYYAMTYSGLQEATSKLKRDFYLYCYSEKDDNMKFFQKIGCNYMDIYHVAELYIEKLYALDKYLSKLKKKDYLV